MIFCLSFFAFAFFILQKKYFLKWTKKCKMRCRLLIVKLKKYRVLVDISLMVRYFFQFTIMSPPLNLIIFLKIKCAKYEIFFEQKIFHSNKYYFSFYCCFIKIKAMSWYYIYIHVVGGSWLRARIMTFIFLVFIYMHEHIAFSNYKINCKQLLIYFTHAAKQIFNLFFIINFKAYISSLSDISLHLQLH